MYYTYSQWLVIVPLNDNYRKYPKIVGLSIIKFFIHSIVEAFNNLTECMCMWHTMVTTIYIQYGHLSINFNKSHYICMPPRTCHNRIRLP